MRRRSFTGPIILILIGALFLAYNLRPDVRMFDVIALYWPFLLIAWGVLRLFEVLMNALAERPLPRGISGGDVVLVGFICLIGSGLYAANRHGFRFTPHGLDVFGEQYDYPVGAQAPAGSAQRIVFENLRGNVRITGADTQEIKITGRKTIRAFHKPEADQADKNTPLELAAEGDRIVVRAHQDRVSSDRRVSEDLDVTVPRALSLEARNRSGDFDVTELNGNVDINSERADVRLNKIGGNARVELGRSDIIRAVDVKGNVELQGRGSDIELENVAGVVTINGSYSGTLDFKNLAKPLHFESQNTDLRVEALPGRISMDLGEFTASNLVGPIRLITKTRDVKIEDFTQALELETERGDIEIQPGRVPLAKIDARSRTGKIDLALPDKATFQLEAKTQHGDALNDFGPAIEKQTEGPAAWLKGSVGKGPAITLSTQRGTVTVRKAGAGSGAAAAKLSSEKF